MVQPWWTDLVEGEGIEQCADGTIYDVRKGFFALQAQEETLGCGLQLAVLVNRCEVANLLRTATVERIPRTFRPFGGCSWALEGRLIPG